MGSQRVEQNSICHSGLRKPILFFIFFFGSCDAAHSWITFSLFLLHLLHLFLDIGILPFSLNNFIYSEYTAAAAAAAAAAKSLESCLTLRPHRRQPTRLPHPWDSPGKNTGVGCHYLLQRMKVKSESEVTQSFWTLSDPMDAAYQTPPSMGFFRQEYWSGLPLPSPLNTLVKLLSRVWLFATPWTVAYQAPPSLRFSRQEDWSGLPFPSPGDLPNPGI